jgi:hypothetical protein
MNTPEKLALLFIQMIGIGDRVSTLCGANTRVVGIGVVDIGLNGERW